MFKISDRLLAEMTGTSRESITRALGRLEKKGWLTRADDKMRWPPN